MGQFELPYASVEEAVKDGWKKIGGPVEALKALKSGYYQVNFRKSMNLKNAALMEAVKKDPRYQGILAEAKKKAKG